MRTLTVKSTSIYGTVIPLVFVVAGLTALLIGLVAAAFGANWSPILIVCGALAVFVGVMPFYREVRRVELSEDGTVRFCYRRQVVSCSLAEVAVLSTKAPDPTSNWPVRFRTPAKVVRVCPQLNGITDLMEAARVANP